MKNCYDFLIEKLIINKDSKSKENTNIDLPKIRQIVFDNLGNEFQILDYCSLINNEEKVNKFIDKYDKSGDFRHYYDNSFDMNDFKNEFNTGILLIVLAKGLSKFNNKENIYLWPIELHTENKPYWKK